MFPIVLLLAASSLSPARCDDVPTAERIDQLEDKAFASMKAANEAVADAARKGSVGAAGDAEWAAYKGYRAEAEQLRLKRLSCQSQQRTDKTISEVALKVAAASQAPSAEASDRHGGRFNLSLNLSAGDYRIGSAKTVSSVSQSGTADLSANIRGGANAVFPPTIKGSFAQINNVVTGAPTIATTHLVTRSWSTQPSLSLGFAPSGQDHDGWRFQATGGHEAFYLKQFLGARLPLVASQTLDATDVPLISAVSATPISFATYGATGVPFNAHSYLLNTYDPITRTVGVLSSDAVNFYNTTQHATKSELEVKIDYRKSALNRDFGHLELAAGITVGVSHRALKEDTFIDVVQGVSPRIFSFERHAVGVGFDAAINVEVTGGFSRWPFRWGLSASDGVETVSVDVQDANHGSNQVQRTKPTSYFGGSLAYDFRPGLSGGLAVGRRQGTYLSFVDGAALGTLLGDGGVVDVRTASSTRYSLFLEYHF